MPGYYDIHTHILPGIDDGACSIEETLKILQMEYADGIRTIYATSHYRRGMFEPPIQEVRRQYLRVRKAAKAIGDDLRIILGCEFHANMDMIEMLDAGERPTLGGSRCVLTEFADDSDARFIQERCNALLMHGYRPVIAHAERYRAVRKDMELTKRLVDMGVFIQMNAGSILGEYGFGAKRYCRKIMEADLLHFIGSDAHNAGGRRPLMGKCIAYIEKLMGRDYMVKLLIENPRHLIEEEQ